MIKYIYLRSRLIRLNVYFLLYIFIVFYNVYLEILKLIIYFKNYTKSKWKKHLKINKVATS